MERKDRAYAQRGVSTPAYISAVVFVVVVATAGAVLIGRSDTGPIDVSNTIKNANTEQIDADGNVTEREENYTPPVLRNKPNGGLVPQDLSGLPATPPPAPETESENNEGVEVADGDTPTTSAEGGTEEVSEGEIEIETGAE